jgi:fermentation-respiration switch protein FrsA (DUF1100 family)
MNAAEQNEHYTFQLSDKVIRKSVTFKNRYGITLFRRFIPSQKLWERKIGSVGNQWTFGAVKEQSSGLYANQMVERGFAVIAFDPSYTGESGSETKRYCICLQILIILINYSDCYFS